MAVFVLVHGAWSGAHGFRKIRGPLVPPQPRQFDDPAEAAWICDLARAGALMGAPGRVLGPFG